MICSVNSRARCVGDTNVARGAWRIAGGSALTVLARGGAFTHGLAGPAPHRCVGPVAGRNDISHGNSTAGKPSRTARSALLAAHFSRTGVALLLRCRCESLACALFGACRVVPLLRAVVGGDGSKLKVRAASGVPLSALSRGSHGGLSGRAAGQKCRSHSDLCNRMNSSHPPRVNRLCAWRLENPALYPTSASLTLTP
jgi:hypothetical protein